LIGAILTGKGLAVGAVGIRKIGSAEPIRVTDRMHLGSCTKAMTATVIGTLIDEGKLTCFLLDLPADVFGPTRNWRH